jgi:hypothetical protein
LIALFRRTSSAVIALRERLVAAGVADPADDLFAAEFLQIIPGMAGPYWHGFCLLSARTRTATSEAVKPLGDGDKAISYQEFA